MKKLLIVSYYWPPSGGPGVQRVVKFSRYLPDYGIEPVVLTVDPAKASYPLIDKSLETAVSERTRVIRTSSFEPLNLYRMLSSGRKLPQPGFANEGKPGTFAKCMRFIRGNFMVPDARKGWNSFAMTACRKLLREETFDAVMTTSPPHSTQLIGLALQQEFRIPWIADLRDPWTDIYYNHELYRLKPAINKDARLEKKVLESANTIMTVSQSLKSLLASKSPLINPNKIHIIPNGFDPEDFPKPASIPGTEKASGNRFTMTYTGTMSEAYPVHGLIETLKRFLTQHPGAGLSMRFVGQISKSIQHRFEEAGLSAYTSFESYVGHDIVPDMMASSSVLLLVIPDVPHNAGILTGKLFEYLGSRRPVLGFGPVDGDAAGILQECHSGKMFAYNDTTAAANWLSMIYTENTNGRRAFSGNEQIRQYTRQEQAKQLAGLIEQI
jgi:glycosyltransferase involved in cell wall biosynthesis